MLTIHLVEELDQVKNIRANNIIVDAINVKVENIDSFYGSVASMSRSNDVDLVFKKADQQRGLGIPYTCKFAYDAHKIISYEDGNTTIIKDMTARRGTTEVKR